MSIKVIICIAEVPRSTTPSPGLCVARHYAKAEQKRCACPQVPQQPGAKARLGLEHPRVGTPFTPTNRTQHPCVEDLPRYLRAILKPGTQCAGVFFWVSRVLKGRMRGLTPLQGEVMKGLFGTRSCRSVLAKSRELAALGTHCWYYWLCGRSWY